MDNLELRKQRNKKFQIFHKFKHKTGYKINNSILNGVNKTHYINDTLNNGMFRIECTDPISKFYVGQTMLLPVPI